LDISEQLEGKELLVYFHKLSAFNNRPYVSFDIENKTNRYLSIRSLSIHINSEVFVHNYEGNEMMLPPQTRSKKTLSLPDGAVNEIEVNLSRDEAERSTLTVGLSALFDDEGSKKTFYQQKNVKYSKALNL
jgi:hypothetical protein